MLLSPKLALVATVKEDDTTLRTLSSNGLRKRWNEGSLCRRRISYVAETCYVRTKIKKNKQTKTKQKKEQAERKENKKITFSSRQTFNSEKEPDNSESASCSV